MSDSSLLYQSTGDSSLALMIAATCTRAPLMVATCTRALIDILYTSVHGAHYGSCKVLVQAAARWYYSTSTRWYCQVVLVQVAAINGTLVQVAAIINALVQLVCGGIITTRAVSR